MRRAASLSILVLGVVALSAPGRLEQRAVTVIAHRGASWEAPEHTPAAWDLALEQGADWIEQDLQLTRDGVLVVLHDDSLDRTARGPTGACSGLVRDRSWEELQRCDVGSWFNDSFPDRARTRYTGQRIPSLDQVLTRYAARGARFYVETKSPEAAPGMEDSLVALLGRHRLAGPGAAPGRVMVQSFSFASLERMHRLDPSIPLVYLVGDSIPADSLRPVLRRVAAIARGIGPSRRVITARLVRAAQDEGLAVHVYTVNDEAVMRFMLGLGVDGMFTDRPALLRQVLAAR